MESVEWTAQILLIGVRVDPARIIVGEEVLCMVPMSQRALEEMSVTNDLRVLCSSSFESSEGIALEKKIITVRTVNRWTSYGVVEVTRVRSAQPFEVPHTTRVPKPRSSS